MAYIKKIWKDYPDTTTQIKAEDLNNIEDGIEALDTGKVNTSDIVDNLTSASATVPLSANMGKSLKDQLDTKLSGWQEITLTGTETGGTITTQIGGVNVDLRNFKLLHIRFRAINNSAHRQNLVMVFPTSNNFLLTQYGNVIHYVTMSLISNGSFILTITPASGSNLIQLEGITGII